MWVESRWRSANRPSLRCRWRQRSRVGALDDETNERWWMGQMKRHLKHNISASAKSIASEYADLAGRAG